MNNPKNETPKTTTELKKIAGGAGPRQFSTGSTNPENAPGFPNPDPNSVITGPSNADLANMSAGATAPSDIGLDGPWTGGDKPKLRAGVPNMGSDNDSAG